MGHDAGDTRREGEPNQEDDQLVLLSDERPPTEPPVGHRGEERLAREREEVRAWYRRGRRWSLIVLVVCVVGIIACVMLMATRLLRMARADDARDRSEAVAVTRRLLTQETEFAGACAALATADAQTITERWPAALRALRPLLDRANGAKSVPGLATWFSAREIERVMTACGIHGDAARALLALIAKNPALSIVLRDERHALCVFGGQLAEVGAATPWTEEVRATWRAACTQLLSGATAATTPSISDAARAPTPTNTTCAGIEELANQRDRVVDRSLARGAWIAYGRALAECTPESQPWAQLRLARGRTQFVEDYVVPFINGDVVRGSWFQNDDGARYDQITSAWLDEE